MNRSKNRFISLAKVVGSDLAKVVDSDLAKLKVNELNGLMSWSGKLLPRIEKRVKAGVLSYTEIFAFKERFAKGIIFSSSLIVDLKEFKKGLGRLSELRRGKRVQGVEDTDEEINRFSRGGVHKITKETRDVFLKHLSHRFVHKKPLTKALLENYGVILNSPRFFGVEVEEGAKLFLVPDSKIQHFIWYDDLKKFLERDQNLRFDSQEMNGKDLDWGELPEYFRFRLKESLGNSAKYVLGGLSEDERDEDSGRNLIGGVIRKKLFDVERFGFNENEILSVDFDPVGRNSQVCKGFNSSDFLMRWKLYFMNILLCDVLKDKLVVRAEVGLKQRVERFVFLETSFEHGKVLMEVNSVDVEWLQRKKLTLEERVVYFLYLKWVREEAKETMFDVENNYAG